MLEKSIYMLQIIRRTIAIFAKYAILYSSFASNKMFCNNNMIILPEFIVRHKGSIILRLITTIFVLCNRSVLASVIQKRYHGFRGLVVNRRRINTTSGHYGSSAKVEGNKRLTQQFGNINRRTSSFNIKSFCNHLRIS